MDAELAKYGAAGIAIAQIIAFVYVFNKLYPIARDLVKSLNHNTEVVKQTYDFMVTLNGKLVDNAKEKHKTHKRNARRNARKQR